MQYFSKRNLSLLLAVFSAASLVVAVTWFFKATAHRTSQRDLVNSWTDVQKPTRSGKKNNGMSVLGLVGVTGLAAIETQALHCEKRAWQFFSLALLFGFCGYFLIRQTNSILELDSSSRNKELFASIFLIRQLAKFPAEESEITKGALLQIVKDSWQYYRDFKEHDTKGFYPNVWYTHCHDAMDLLGFESAGDFFSACDQIDGDSEFLDESSDDHESLNVFITTSLKTEHAREWKW